MDALKKFRQLDLNEKYQMIANGRTSVKEITQFINGDFVKKYIPRVAGLSFTPEDREDFCDTPDEARKAAKEIREKYKTMAKGVSAFAEK